VAVLLAVVAVFNAVTADSWFDWLVVAAFGVAALVNGREWYRIRRSRPL
jgi:hypothetical protein